MTPDQIREAFEAVIEVAAGNGTPYDSATTVAAARQAVAALTASPASETGWRPIATLPMLDNEGGGGIAALVWGATFGIGLAHRCGVLPWGDVTGHLPSFSGSMTEWGITHWRPLPEVPHVD